MTPEAVSQQLWTLLDGLVKADATTKRGFATVPRHNGFEARRRVPEPVTEDKALLRKDLLLDGRPSCGTRDLGDEQAVV